MKIQVVANPPKPPKVVQASDVSGYKYYGALIINLRDMPSQGKTRSFIVGPSVHTGNPKEYRCCCEHAFTTGNYFLDYTAPSLSELILLILNQGGKVYQFDSLLELMKWVTEKRVDTARR